MYITPYNKSLMCLRSQIELQQKKEGEKLEQFVNVGHCFENGMNSGQFEQVMVEHTSFTE